MSSCIRLTVRWVPAAACVLGLALATCGLSGCASAPAAQASAQDAGAPGGDDRTLANLLASRPQHLLDDGSQADAHAPRVERLDVYQLNLPLGAVSRSDEFWKRVDEMAVEPATYDLLLKNGIRVGVAPHSEWAYFKAIIDQYPAKARSATLSGGDGGAVQLSMKQNIDFQNIFYFDDANVLYGRTYERCENLLGVSFQPAPRRPGTARLSVCPIVRSLRKRFEVTVRGDEREIEYVNPENLYDLNLITDVPPDGFLVVAPSSHAKWASSLGNTFLIGGGLAEEFEQVLLLVPRVMKPQ